MSVDPLALYDPVKEVEHYIDGEHNGGYYNPRNMSVFGYCYQNPVLYVDPNGKQGIAGALLGAFTEYASAVGEKMLKGQTFAQANKALNRYDAGKIGLAAGIGSVSGTAKFAKWASSSSGRKILVKMFEIGLGSVQDIINQYIGYLETGEKINLKLTLVSTLTDLGMGYLLKGTSLEKMIARQDEIITKAENEIDIIKLYNVGNASGQQKKIRTQEAIIKKTAEDKNYTQNVSNVVNEISTTGAQTVTKELYNDTK